MSGYRPHYGSIAFPYPQRHPEQPSYNPPDPTAPRIRLPSLTEGGAASGGTSAASGVHGAKAYEEQWIAAPRHLDYAASQSYWSPTLSNEGGAQPYRLPVSSALGLSLAPLASHPHHQYSSYPRTGQYSYYPSNGVSPPIPRLKSDYSDPIPLGDVSLASNPTSHTPYATSALLTPIQTLAETYDHSADHFSTTPQYPFPSSPYLAARPDQTYVINNPSTLSYGVAPTPAEWMRSSVSGTQYRDSVSVPVASVPSESSSSRTASFASPDDEIAGKSGTETVGTPQTKKKGKEGKRGAVKKWACAICTGDAKRSFARPSALKIHMLTHTKEKPHICHICNRAFAISSNLKRHYKLHQQPPPQ